MVAFSPLKNSRSRSISSRPVAHVGAGVPANINKHRGLSPRGYDFAEAERVMYDAYGRQTVLANNGVVAYKPSDYGQFVGFTGRYHDWETGLQYFRARYFDNTLGRFIGRDPLGYVDGMGLYSGYFVPNNLDPSGTINDNSPNNPIPIRPDDFPDVLPVLEVIGGAAEVVMGFVDGIAVGGASAVSQGIYENDYFNREGTAYQAGDVASWVDPKALGIKGLKKLIEKGISTCATKAEKELAEKAAKELAEREAKAAAEKATKGGGGKFPDAKELARRLGGDVHEAKSKMKRDPRIKEAMNKIGSTNPDIGYDKAGNIVLKNPKTGVEINTDVPLNGF